MPKPAPLIFKGQDTYYGQFPWHVAVFLNVSHFNLIKYAGIRKIPI